ncbi:MAG TPA: diguanylate cyclase [Myxococcota bacterium]|nr:diguanylate cyclase [Myxococcota bacterium]
MLPEAPARPRVLVVDDDRLNREILRDVLADRAEVECAASAEAALEALARRPVDLVISDLTMPGLSGTALLERVRREHPDTDFVLLTAHASVESAVAALRMGAADYLTKPVQAEELVLVVERIFSRRRLLAENVRLREALQAVESCRTLLRCLDPGEVYAVALDLLLHAVGRDRGLALFRRTSLPSSDGVAFRGFDEAEARGLRRLLVVEKQVDFDLLGASRVVAEGPVHEALGALGLAAGAALVVPLRGRETEAGAIWLFEDERPLAGADLERAALVTAHAEVALHNAERYHRAKERAFIDDVTEVYNARFLLQATDREVQRAERYAKELCVVFLDLDRFKSVNDQHGHLVGSQVLRRLSQVLRECIRQVDTLARYGGDEFTILLADTALDDGLHISERIRRTVAETAFESGGGPPIRLTISIGVAAYPLHGRDRTALLDAADKAMYRAKSRGRNCVCSASEL